MRCGPYCASKHAIKGMTEGLRQEVGEQGIRVCSIMPGTTATEVAETIDDPTLRGMIHDFTHKEGTLLPEDVAASIVFVVSLPPRANVSELLIRPTIDVDPLL